MAKTYRVIFGSEAEDDLDSILAYIGRDSSINASRFVARLWNAAMTLSEFPQRYRVRQRRKQPELAIRAMPLSMYLIYYRIAEVSNVVRVLTIRHGARRAPRW